MPASSYYIMIVYIPRCKHIIIILTVQMSADLQKHLVPYIFIRFQDAARIFHTIWIWNVPFLREYTSVYRDHRVSIGLCKWRHCILLRLTVPCVGILYLRNLTLVLGVKDLVLGGFGGLQLRYEPGNERL